IREDLGELPEPVTRQWTEVKTAEDLEAAEGRPAPEVVVVTRAIPDEIDGDDGGRDERERSSADAGNGSAPGAESHSGAEAESAR
ncbi:MAG: BCCT family transporter, partial [Rhodococcus sp. (in: high G+C Gram-positive bacteria)]